MIQYLTEGELNEIKQISSSANHSGFQIGPQSPFILSNTYHILLEISGSINDLLEQDATEWKRQMVSELLQTFVIKNHLSATLQLFRKATDTLRNLNDVSATANLEFNIKTQEGKEKRLMMQFCMIQHANSHLNHIITGSFVDISHLIREGSPRLVLLKGNCIFHRDVPTPEDILKNETLQITPKELSMLALKAKGMRGKEIAEQLGVTLLTVYSMTRDIKQKTNMDVYPLIQKLREKGLLTLYCSQIVFDEFVSYTFMMNSIVS